MEAAVKPLMAAAEAGLVLMGDEREAASNWDGLKIRMRDLATDKMAEVIVLGAFDDVDEEETGFISGEQLSYGRGLKETISQVKH